MIELKNKCLDFFIRQINKDFKWDFDPQYVDSKSDMLAFSFLDIHKYLINRTNSTIDEIHLNLLMMSDDKHLSYLNYVEERIKRDVVSNIDSSFLDKWIEKFEIKELEFPFTENNDLKNILSNTIDEYMYFVYTKDELDMQIQKDFYLYAYYLGKIKIIDFIESKRKNFVQNVISIKDLSNENDESIKTENPYPQIFSNLKAFHLFDRLYEQFKDSKNQIADFSFIYRMMFNESFILPHFKPQMFIDWIDVEPYKISLEKIKTMGDCSTEQKIRTYNNTKEIIQI
jgi:hypothetical protein